MLIILHSIPLNHLHPPVPLPAMRRACDRCISRKLKCDGGHPCSRCQQSSEPECTFLKPAAKRGPKVSVIQWQQSNKHKSKRDKAIKSVPNATLTAYVDVYASKLYPVWPVLESASLLNRLCAVDEDNEAYLLALALSAATSAQLQLPPLGPDPIIDAAFLAAQTIQYRSTYDYREKSSYDEVLASFFLHVYYATLLKSHTSMMFLQEAITFAKLLEVKYEEENSSCLDKLQTLLTFLVSILKSYSYRILTSKPLVGN